MSPPQYTVTAYFDLPAGGELDIFTLDDPIKGVLDSAYVLAGDIATDITGYVRRFSTRRGKSRIFDEITAGTCTIELNNSTRAFDSLYTAGPFYGNIRPGKRFTVAVNGTAIFDGVVESWRYQYGRNRCPVAIVTLVDALATLAAKDFDEWTTTAGQTVGVRLEEIFGRSEVRYTGGRFLDAGVTTLQADTVPDGTNVLAYGQWLAKTDFGRFFAGRDGPIVFRDRQANLNADAALTFTNDGSGIRYVDLERAAADEMLFNRIISGRRGGPTQVFENVASIAEYGTRAFTIDDLLVETDDQAYDYGLFLATYYSEPEERFSSFTVEMAGLSETNQTLVAGLDISSLVDAVYAPALGDPIERSCIVEGIEYTVERNRHHAKVLVGDAVNRAAFILDDPIWGVLDGPGVLTF